MNLKAVHDRVAEVLPKDQSFCITLELWNHRGGGLHADVSIWDAERKKSYHGPTPQVSLECFLADHGALSVEVPEAVVLPTLCGNGEVSALVAAVAAWDSARLGIQDSIGDRSDVERTNAHVALQAAERDLLRALRPFRR